MKSRMRQKKWKGKVGGRILRFDGKSNLNMLISCASVIMIWRGIWDLCDTFIFPNHHILSDLICIILGIIVPLLDDGKLGELA